VSERAYEGPGLDGSVQYLSEALYWQGDGKTVDDGNASADEAAVGEVAITPEIPSHQKSKPQYNARLARRPDRIPDTSLKRGNPSSHTLGCPAASPDVSTDVFSERASPRR